MSRREASSTAPASTPSTAGQRRHVEAGVQLDGHGIDGEHGEGSAAASRRASRCVQLDGHSINGEHREGSAAASRVEGGVEVRPARRPRHRRRAPRGQRRHVEARPPSTWTAATSTASTARAAAASRRPAQRPLPRRRAPQASAATLRSTSTWTATASTASTPPRRGTLPARRPRPRRRAQQASAAASRRPAQRRAPRGERRRVEAGVQLDGRGINGNTARAAPPRRGGRPVQRPRHRRRAPRGQRRRIEAGVHLDGHGIDGEHREVSAAASRRASTWTATTSTATPRGQHHREGSATASRRVHLLATCRSSSPVPTSSRWPRAGHGQVPGVPQLVHGRRRAAGLACRLRPCTFTCSTCRSSSPRATSSG